MIHKQANICLMLLQILRNKNMHHSSFQPFQSIYQYSIDNSQKRNLELQAQYYLYYERVIFNRTVIIQKSIYERAIHYLFIQQNSNLQFNQMEYCKCGLKIYRLCINQNCQHPAQFCDDPKCKYYLEHEDCPSVIQRKILQVDSQIQKNASYILKKANVVMIQLAEELKLSLQQGVQKRSARKMGKAIKKIKRRRNQERRITGKLGKQAFEEMNNFKDSKKIYEKSFDQYRKMMETFRSNILQQRSKFLAKIIGQESQSEEFVMDLEENISPPLQNPVFQLSNVLGSDEQSSPQNNTSQTKLKTQRFFYLPENQIKNFLTENEAYRNLFVESFGDKKIKIIQKVFTASAKQNMTSTTNKLGMVEDRKNLSELFKKCGQINNPLILAKIKYKPQNEQFIFGAWTPLKYGDNYKKYKHDPSYSSRIFWFDQQIVFPLKNDKRQNNQALITDIGYGMIFGNDLDIKISGKCSNRVRIGNQYSTSHLSNQQKAKLDSCHKKMAESHKSEVIDYQIYQIEFEEEIKEAINM